MQNYYEYPIQKGRCKGQFNIYQSVGGHIMIVMGNRFTPLSREQIEDLAIFVYDLIDFDIEIFQEAYGYTPPEV